MYQVFYALQAAFTVWMLIDCVQRGAESYWYMVTMTPGGAWVYFFSVKVWDYDWSWLRRLLNPPPSVEALRYAAQESPSLANQLALGEGLLRASRHAEAIEAFESALRTRSDEPAAHHGIGLARLALGDVQPAIESLSRAVAIDRGFREYRACVDLAEALTRDARDEEALELLREVARERPTMAHRLALARRLLDLGHTVEARDELDRALLDHRHAPGYVKRRDGRAAWSARRLRRTLGR